MAKAGAGEETVFELSSILEPGKSVTLKSGSFASFDRKTGTWSASAPLPELKDLEDPSVPKFVKEAVCAAYKASGTRFFAGSDERCN